MSIDIGLAKQIEAALDGMEGWCTIEKAMDLADWVVRIKPAVSVELGVFGGKSLVPIALALKEVSERCHGTKRVVYGIDPWTTEAALEGDIGQDNEQWWRDAVDLHQIHRLCMEAIWKNGLSEHAVVIRTTAEMAEPLFRDGTVGFLHQDSNHSELVSCRQARLWAPKMARGGIWVMDDADWASQAAAIKMIPSFGFKKVGGTEKYLIFQREK